MATKKKDNVVKQYLWLFGLLVVVIGAILYAVANNSASQSIWMLATLLEIIGGVILIASYFQYHQKSR